MKKLGNSKLLVCILPLLISIPVGFRLFSEMFTLLVTIKGMSHYPPCKKQDIFK